MAKISPVSIKYMIHATFSAEGMLEKPDVIGALFGQTEGLLGSDLEMRELQKEGKIGRIEVELERKDRKTMGEIKIPTALDKSETTLIAAAIETIERIGPSDSQIEITKIEDVRGTKRDYIVERAKKLMKEIEGATDSREISNTVKDSSRSYDVQEYGDEKLPCGDLSGEEIIVVEGRADVLNLIRNGVNNVIAMNGTKLPEGIRKLSKEKTITLFLDGDRGGKLIAANVIENAEIDYIAVAPDGKEVEELQGKEILMNLRKKVPVSEFLSRNNNRDNYRRREERYDNRDSRNDRGYEREREEKQEPSKRILSSENKEKLKNISKEISESGKAIILNESLEEIKSVSSKSLMNTLSRIREKPYAIVIDGTGNLQIIKAAESLGCSIVVAKNFTTTESTMQLLSL